MTISFFKISSKYFKVKLKASLLLLCVFSLTFAEGSLFGKPLQYAKDMHERENRQKERHWQDKINYLKNSKHPLSSSREYAVVRMRIYREMKTNPEAYWAFHSATQGPDEWEAYTRAKKTGKLNSFIVNTLSSIRIGAGIKFKDVGVGVKIPLMPEDLKNKLTESFIQNPDMPNLPEIATLATNLLFEDKCKDLGIPCAKTDTLPDDPDTTGVLFNEGTLYSAMAVTNRESSTWPKSTDSQYLEEELSEEYAVVSAMQTEKNTRKIMDMITEKNRLIKERQVKMQKEMQEEQEKQPVKVQKKTQKAQYARQTLEQYDPFTRKEDKMIAKLRTSQDTFEKEVKDIDVAIEDLPTDSDPEKLKELVAKRNDSTQKALATKKAIKLYEHKKFCANITAWTGAATATAQLVLPPEMAKDVVKYGNAVNIGTKIFETSWSMVINGALDPTGITAILTGVSGLISLFSNTPSTEEVMIEKLDEILKNQKEMLANQKKLLEGQRKILAGQRRILAGQEKILKRLDKMEQRLLDKFGELENILSKNHQEILEGQQEIQDSIKNLHTDMLAGFEEIKQKMDDAEYTDWIIEAQSSYFPYYDSSDPFLQKDLSRCQQDAYYCFNNEAKEITKKLTSMGNFLNRIPKSHPVSSKNFFNLQNESNKSENDSSVFSNDNRYKANGYKDVIQEKQAIQNLLNSPLQSRIPYLYSMMLWLEDHLNSMRKNKDNNHTIPNKDTKAGLDFIPHLVWQNPDLKTPVFEHIKDAAGNSIIPTSNKEFFKSSRIGNNPALQDELFAEAVNLNVVLPDKRTELSSRTVGTDKKSTIYDTIHHKLKYPYMEPICKFSQAAGNMAWLMRANLPAAWQVYMKHHMQILSSLQNYNKNSYQDIRLEIKPGKSWASEAHKIPGIPDRENNNYFIVQHEKDLKYIKKTYKLNKRAGFNRTCKPQQHHYTHLMKNPYKSSHSDLKNTYGDYKENFKIGKSFLFVELKPDSSGEFDMVFTLKWPNWTDINDILRRSWTTHQHFNPVFEHPLFDHFIIKNGFYKTEMIKHSYFWQKEKGYHPPPPRFEPDGCRGSPCIPLSVPEFGWGSRLQLINHSKTVCKKGERIYHHFLFPRKREFLNEHRHHWLKQIWEKYREGMKDMYKNDDALLVDFMKAHLIFDTMLKIGYGSRLLNSHPDLQYLKKLTQGMGDNMEERPEIKDEDKLDRYSDRHRSGRIKWGVIRNELKSMSSFLKKGEKANSMASYYTWLADLTDTKKEEWVHESLWPKCESKTDRLEYLILYIKKQIHRLQAGSQDMQNNFEESMVEKPAKAIENEAQIARWQKTLNNLLNSDGNSPLIQGDQNHLTNAHIYPEWKYPLCGSAADNNNTKRFIKNLLESKLKYYNRFFAPELPVIPEESWQGQAIGWGRPDLRKKAFQKARMYDHIDLKECQIIE